jgi:FkbM family methyltransferase
MKLGTKYGGWFLPDNCVLDTNSVVYSGGVGEDMSFDLKLQDIFNCNIYLIDPTEKAIKHYNECIKYYTVSGFKFTGGIQKDYYEHINGLNIDFDKIQYINMGIWDKKDTLKFYKQANDNFVSQSLINGMFSNNYDVVEVDSIKNIMKLNNHDHIDLLKIDIEGAENVVLDQMLNDEIYPKYLCVEFDLLLKRKDRDNSTLKVINRLQENGYKIVMNDNLNITFEQKN